MLNCRHPLDDIAKADKLRPNVEKWQAMRHAAYLVFLTATFVTASGCDELKQQLVRSAVYSTIGEDSKERCDRIRFESYQKAATTPGRSQCEIDEKAREAFRRIHGRDPHLNWHAK